MALFVAIMLAAFGAMFPPTLEQLARTRPVWGGPIALVEFLGAASLTTFCYLFPDGRFVPRWTRALAIVAVILHVPVSFLPGSPLSYLTWPAPLRALPFFGLLGTGIVAQLYRYRRVSGPTQRQQTKYAVFGVTAALAGFLGLILLSALAPSWPEPDSLAAIFTVNAYYAIMLPIPLSIGAAILRHRLWGIDPLINRTLVYGALTACVIGLYMLVVGSLGAVFDAAGSLAISLVATALVAVLFQPLRERLQRGVNRLLYGERDDPYAVLSRLGQRLEATLAPEAVLPTIVATAAEALKLPYAAIALKQDGSYATAAATGTPVPEPLRLPLVYQQEQVGELLLAPRAPGEDFGPADRRLLDDLARQASVAAHAVRLTAELQRSRERLVAAREEERRRLRRDLHDGLGPQLAGFTLRLDAVRRLLRQDPDAAEAVVLELKERSQAVVAEIRRLVHALRPPALDELGLVGALRQQAAQHTRDGVDVAVEAPERLPPLPAAVEVAAYRIAQEALTNVVRHAQARTAVVRLALDEPAGALRLEVADDGRGLPASPRAGVGLASMRERAAELGGACTVESRPGGGTRVSARLPLGETSGVGRDELGDQPQPPRASP